VSYASAFNIIGLLINLAGVILLFVCLFQQPNPKDVSAESWYDVLGWFGLALIVLGAGAQIKAILLS
jgi:hypothetical protein